MPNQLLCSLQHHSQALTYLVEPPRPDLHPRPALVVVRPEQFPILLPPPRRGGTLVGSVLGGFRILPHPLDPRHERIELADRHVVEARGRPAVQEVGLLVALLLARIGIIIGTTAAAFGRGRAAVQNVLGNVTRAQQGAVAGADQCRPTSHPHLELGVDGGTGLGIAPIGCARTDPPVHDGLAAACAGGAVGRGAVQPRLGGAAGGCVSRSGGGGGGVLHLDVPVGAFMGEVECWHGVRVGYEPKSNASNGYISRSCCC